MESPKKKILIFSDWYLPAYKAGGPIKSIYSLVNTLGQEFDLSIICSDRDQGELEPLSGIKTEEWCKLEAARVMYIPVGKMTSNFLNDLIKAEGFEVLYFNSLFSLPFTLKPLLFTRGSAVKKVLAPRGMLGAGALAIKSFKKKIFLQASRTLGLYKNVMWHSTAPEETQEIKQHFGSKINFIEARNFSASNVPSDYDHSVKKENGTLNLFFLSRISKKKNLKMALELIANFKGEGEINYHIIGPEEELDYLKECKAIVSRFPTNAKAIFHGSVPNQNLHDYLKEMHFLLLPTFNENYGHVIVESWDMGCPVIISDQTPWKKLERKKLGWELPLADLDSWSNILEQCVRMNESDYTLLSEASSTFAKSIRNDEVLKQQYLKLFGQ